MEFSVRLIAAFIAATFTPVLCVTTAQENAAISGILSAITADPSNTAGFVRLAFHDCVGGCDGCINVNSPDNAGLRKYIDVLETKYVAFKATMTRADFWMLAAVTSLRQAALPGGQPTLTTKYGRRDCPTAPFTDTILKFPDPHRGLNETVTFFAVEFGFNLKDTVAILGAHSLGRARQQNSGFDGQWVSNPQRLENSFYKALLGFSWSQGQVPTPSTPPPPPPVRRSATSPSTPRPSAPKFQWNAVNERNRTLMMLNSDVCLVAQVQPRPDGSVSPNRLSLHALSSGRPFVVTYASNNAVWIKDFSSAFQRLIERCRLINGVCPYTLSPRTT